MTGEAVVIGGGINGLVAATYLAKAGRRVTLLEARPELGGLCRNAKLGAGISAPAFAHSLYALDPRAVRELKLSRHGLRFSVRDMPLVGLRGDGRHVVAGRDVHRTVRSLAVHSASDAQLWPRFRRDLFQAARAVRRIWWDNERSGRPAKPPSRMRRASADAWLDVRFESETLRSLLLFDATDGGLSPLDAGSSLLLLWRAAQEMCGLQGAVAMSVGGPAALAAALESSARASGVSIRVECPVRYVAVQTGTVLGVELESGEQIDAPLVLSSLSARRTLKDLVRSGDGGLSCDGNLGNPQTGAAKVLLAFHRLPPFGGIDIPQNGRFIVAEHPGSMADAHEAARIGKLPHELVFEFVRPTVSDPGLSSGEQVLSVLVRPVPLAPAGGWPATKALLAARVLAALERFAPGLSREVIAARIFSPDDWKDGTLARMNPCRMVLDWQTRARTPVKNLWLCGADADVLAAVSGRAGRIVAQLALRDAVRA